MSLGDSEICLESASQEQEVLLVFVTIVGGCSACSSTSICARCLSRPFCSLSVCDYEQEETVAQEQNNYCERCLFLNVCMFREKYCFCRIK